MVDAPDSCGALTGAALGNQVDVPCPGSAWRPSGTKRRIPARRRH